MGTKNRPGKFDCYTAAEPDEPMFVLLGRDPLAGALVRLWCVARDGTDEIAQINEAQACANDLISWATKKKGKQEVLASWSRLQTAMANALDEWIISNDPDIEKRQEALKRMAGRQFEVAPEITTVGTKTDN